ncbi:MAG: helix-turn-helix domain-containing protein [archaeon]
MTNKYIMLSLDDEATKHLSEVIGNESCKKILSMLAEHGDEGLTETEISQKLKMPLNTIDYNIKKLVKSGLIEQAKHFWSVRGKRMPAYRVSNKKIILSPKKSKISALKNLVLPAAITGALALVLRQISIPAEIITNSDMNFKESVDGALMASTTSVASGAAPVVGDSASALQPTIWNNIISNISSIPTWEWFLIGAWLAIVLFFVLNIKNNK